MLIKKRKPVLKLKFEGNLTPVRLQAIRLLLKETLLSLSEKTGFPGKYIYKIESGKITPPTKHVKSILAAMGVHAKNPKVTHSTFEEKRFSEINFKLPVKTSIR